MNEPAARPAGHGLRLGLAWAVHCYTAFGAVLGFVALERVFAGDHRTAFALLAAALLIDASDGAFARAVGVRKLIPWIDGEVLDNLVDYLNYVVVPVAVFVQPGVLPAGAWPLPLLVLLASAYGFSRTDAKGMVEHYFQGFPSYWNVVAFYFVVLATPPGFNLAVLLVLLGLVFVPMRWLYPSRMERFRTTTLLLGLPWAAMGAVLIARLPEPSPLLGLVSLFYPLYYTVGSVVFHFRSA
ncbi:MAG: CDP-alcohol phosphatidyltransferase family protein [Deltaproteobacteria bacterium]